MRSVSYMVVFYGIEDFMSPRFSPVIMASLSDGGANGRASAQYPSEKFQTPKSVGLAQCGGPIMKS